MQSEILIKTLLAFVIALATAIAVTPVIKKLAPVIGAVDIPKDERRMHDKPMPLCGGIAIFLGFSVSSFIFADLSSEFWGIWLGALFIIIIGILDDIFSLNAYIKLAGQIVGAAIPTIFGLNIEYINIFGNQIHLGVIGIPLTIIWIVALTNAFNLIDGLDGLSCGVSSVCSVAFFSVGIISQNSSLMLISAVLFGSTLGFLPYNFNPAKIFMGDTGAMFLGYIFASAAVLGVYQTPTNISMAVPFIICGLPIFDTSFAFIRRIISGKSPFSADRGHLHHKLIDRGLTQKQTVLFLYTVSILLSIFAIIICLSQPLARIIITAAVIIAMILLLILAGKRQEKSE